MNPDGSFSYTPAAGYNGLDAFTYAATNSAGSAQATVSLTVTAPPPPPTATADDYTVDQDAALTVTAPAGVLANDISGSGGPLTATAVSGPTHGTLALNADGSFTYTPVAGYNGPDTFRYRASDGAGSAQADVAIDVRPPQPVVTPPTANPDRYATRQDTPLTVTAATGVLANDTGSALTAASVTNPTHGTLALNADGSFLYTPTAGYNGPDAFTYAAANSAGSAQATVTLTVQPPPVPPPTANADNYSTEQNTPLTVAAASGVLANDTGRALTAASVTEPGARHARAERGRLVQLHPGRRLRRPGHVHLRSHQQRRQRAGDRHARRPAAAVAAADRHRRRLRHGHRHAADGRRCHRGARQRLRRGHRRRGRRPGARVADPADRRFVHLHARGRLHRAGYVRL